MFRWSTPVFISAAVALSSLFPIAATASGCADTLGHRVILAADAVDPNVLVWERRMSMLDYTAGIWMSARSIVDQTMLAKPGTRAIIVSCMPNEVHPRFSTPSQDAIGLRLLSGPNIGRYGWAVEEDVHTLR